MRRKLAYMVNTRGGAHRYRHRDRYPTYHATNTTTTGPPPPVSGPVPVPVPAGTGVVRAAACGAGFVACRVAERGTELRVEAVGLVQSLY